MKHKFLLKTVLLLSALVAGTSMTWAAEGDEITSIANIVDGKSYYIKGVRTSNTYYLTFTDAVGSQSGTESSTTAGAQLITFHKQSADVYFLETASGNFIAPGTSNGKINVSASGISVTASNQSSKIRLSITSGSNTWSIQKNTSAANFGGYKNTQTDITLIEGPAAVTPCATPTFSPSAGTYTSAQSVTISTETAGATIYYTTDGTTPSNSNGTAYSSAITVSSTQTIKAIAVKDGNSDSEVATATYTITSAVATTTTINATGITNTDVYVSTAAGSFAATVKDNEDATIAAAAVTWSSSNTDVATINATTGAVTLVAAGSTTITASYAGVVDTYQPSSDTYELTVTSSAPITDETITFSELYNANKTLTDIEINANYFSVTFAKPSGTAPQYYTTGTAVRAYAGNTFTVSSDSKTVEKIELTFGESDGSNTISTDVGSYSAGTWTGLASSVTFTIGGSTGNRRISAIKVFYDNRVESDLTKTGNVTLDFKDGNTVANLTDYFTSSSTGEYTYTIADETVIENDDELISALKVGATTVTVSQAADATYRAGEITINVTVNDTRTACVTGLDLSSAKTISLDDAGDLTATSTKDGDFTGTINYTYESADPSIFYIDGDEYLGAAVGGTTVTVTATPTGGNAASYSAVSQVVNVKVNGTNSISLNKSSYSETSGSQATFDIAVTTPVNYDGTITAVSSNTAIATVSVEGTTVTVTPQAVVGTATITITASTGTYYPTTDSKTCAVEITAPEGSDKAPDTDVTYTFDFSTNTNWNFPTVAKTGENTYTYDGKTVTLNTPDESNGYKYNTSTSALLIGKSGATLTLPAFDKPITKISTIAVSGASGKVTQNIYVGSTEVSAETTDATKNHNYAINSEYQAAGTIYTFKVTNDNNTQLSQLTVHMYQAPNETVTLNKNGYATYCSVNPMDFSSTEGYTAWRISNIDADGTITFNKITEAIKGGQGVLLFNKDADGENTSNVTVNFADGSTVFTSSENKLIGTTAPTYVDAETVYGLSNNKFVKNSAAGNIPAGKAYLEASSIPAGVKAFTFVFEDEADGIAETRQATREEVEAIFNLAGQRIQKMQKGINIVNGKKILK